MTTETEYKCERCGVRYNEQYHETKDLCPICFRNEQAQREMNRVKRQVRRRREDGHTDNPYSPGEGGFSSLLQMARYRAYEIASIEYRFKTGLISKSEYRTQTAETAFEKVV